jgi:hypothetical protein
MATTAAILHCKIGSLFSRPQTGCHLQNSRWPGIIKLFPARESLVSDPAEDGKISNYFLQCTLKTSKQYSSSTVVQQQQEKYKCNNSNIAKQCSSETVQQRKQKTSRKTIHNRAEKVAQPQQQKCNHSCNNDAAETLL